MPSAISGADGTLSYLPDGSVVADEPSLGELSRRTDHLTVMLTQLVPRNEYAADRRYDDRRFAEMEADIAEVKRQLADDIRALRESAEKRGSNLRQAIYAGLLPAVLMMLGFAVQIWLARGGP